MSTDNMEKNSNNNSAKDERQGRNCDLDLSEVLENSANAENVPNVKECVNSDQVVKSMSENVKRNMDKNSNALSSNKENADAFPRVIHGNETTKEDAAKAIVPNTITNSASNQDKEKIIGMRSAEVLQNVLIQEVKKLDISGKPNTEPKKQSAVILKQESDSLKNLLIYDSNSSDDNEDDDYDDFEKNWQLHAVQSSSTDTESDSNESLEGSSDNDNDDVISSNMQNNKGAIKKDIAKLSKQMKSIQGCEIYQMAGTLDLSALDIDYEKEEFLHIGHVNAIIETLVTIEAIAGTPAYDLESVLFIDDKTTKKPLGEIDDVLGPVTSPLYCVRFNTLKDLNEQNVKEGMKVYSAPKSKYTHYVFLKELMKNKGTDASWEGDTELPEELVELSDDENEHNLQNARQAQKRKHGSLERHREFERSMNHCNTLNTRVTQLVDAHRRFPRPIPYSASQRTLTPDFNMFPVTFNPTVPPPGFQDYSRLNSLPVVRPPPAWTMHQQSSPRPPHPRYPHPSTIIHGQNNSANYYTNNVGRYHNAGPSNHPF